MMSPRPSASTRRWPKAAPRPCRSARPSSPRALACAPTSSARPGWSTARPRECSSLECGRVSAMLSWQVGRVKITRLVEMDLPVPARVIPQATAAELLKSAWLYPHFVSEDDATLKLSIHALLVETPGLKLVVDTCIGNG